jgi:hypothetical protein
LVGLAFAGFNACRSRWFWLSPDGAIKGVAFASSVNLSLGQAWVLARETGEGDDGWRIPARLEHGTRCYYDSDCFWPLHDASEGRGEMEENRPDALIERIARLEKSLTRVRWGLSLLGIAMAALIGVIAVLLSARPSTLATVSAGRGRVSAREFVVTDDRGQIVGWFGNLNGFSGLILTASKSAAAKSDPPAYIEALGKLVEKQGGAYLVVNHESAEMQLTDRADKNGKTDIVSLKADRTSGHESALNLTGSKGMTASLSADAAEETIPESARLILSQPFPSGSLNKAHMRQVDVNLDFDGSSHLQFSDFLHTPFARFEVDAGEKPTLDFFDDGGDQRVQFALSKDGEPSLSLWGKGEKTYKGAFLNENGLVLTDENRKARAVLGSTSLETIRTGATETTAPGSLTLFDKNGRVIWQVPP